MLLSYGYETEVGVDEVARGCLFGRLYVAVVNYGHIENKEIKDSKKIPRKKRLNVAKWIKKNVIEYAIGYAEAYEIDIFNVNKATILAIERALSLLTFKPKTVIIDGINWKIDGYNVVSIVKGDNKYYSIAAASILAKEYHDQYIRNLCKTYPIYIKYDLLNNYGYGTKKHMESIKENGVSDLHRLSYIKY